MGFASAITLSKLAEIKIKVKCSAVTSPLLLSCREKQATFLQKFLQFCALKSSCSSNLNALSQFLQILKTPKAKYFERNTKTAIVPFSICLHLPNMSLMCLHKINSAVSTASVLWDATPPPLHRFEAETEFLSFMEYDCNFRLNVFWESPLQSSIRICMQSCGKTLKINRLKWGSICSR